MEIGNGLTQGECVEVAYNLLFVHVLADEDYLLHAVSVFFVPVAHQSGFLAHQFNQVFFGAVAYHRPASVSCF